MTYLSQNTVKREFHELQRISRDIAHMLYREPFERALEHLNQKCSSREIREGFTAQEGERLEKHGRRQMPYDRPSELSAILKFKKVKHRQLAIQFACGKFPQLSTTEMEDKFGDEARHHMEMLSGIISRYQLEPGL